MEDEGWWWVSAKMKQFWQQLRAQSLLEVQHCFRQQLPDCGDVSPPYCSTSTACRVEMSASGSHVACLVRPTHSPLTSPQSFSSSSFFFSSFSFFFSPPPPPSSPPQCTLVSRLPLLGPVYPSMLVTRNRCMVAMHKMPRSRPSSSLT